MNKLGEGAMCDHCGEEFKEGDDRAEIWNPKKAHPLTWTVHAEPCATELLNKGWEIA